MTAAPIPEVRYDAHGIALRCRSGSHDYESMEPWGIIYGVSRCRKCGTAARIGDVAGPEVSP